ncbi:MAG: calcium/sodium antiporter [Betaproteobacteria bacterium]|nr:calcium/sodium antiporter [Betaproteobacteria bacterium]
MSDALPPQSALLVLGGLVALYLGANALVKGAASLALRLGMSPLLVGLTVVAFATSTPELFVVVGAALDGREGLSIGNVIGANMLNTGLILGLTALIMPLSVQFQLVRVDVPIMILAAVALMLAAADGVIGRLDGGMFLGAIAGYLAFSVVMARREHSRRVLEEYREEAPHVSRHIGFDVGFVVLGVALLAGGAELLVSGAVGIARAAGLSDTVVGITVVALGTTLPELVTSVLAAVRKHGDIAVGNVVGSNIFNVFCVIGFAATLHPLDASGVARRELLTLLALSALVLPVMWRGYVVNRIEGGALVACYLAAIAFVLGALD